MTRVSDNSKHEVLNHNLARTKEKLENLQIKGSSLKRMIRPSDDPAGNVSLMTLRSRLTNNEQFLRNLNYAKSHLELTENAVSDLSNVISRAKEISLAHSSSTLNAEARMAAAEEVGQLFTQALAIGNRKAGNKYLFGGYVTHRRPFDSQGNYLGDRGRTFIEIEKDFFVPINLTGAEVFFHATNIAPLEEAPRPPVQEAPPEKSNWEVEAEERLQRDIASAQPPVEGVFHFLKQLQNALNSGNIRSVQNLLDNFDQTFSRLITLRTKVGAAHRSVMSAEESIADDNIANADRRSRIEDADINELFSELERQNNVLEATYKSGASLVNRSLLDFLK